jgi:hypothetical protein
MPASPGPIRRRRAEFVVRAAFVCARPPSPVTHRPPPHCRLGRRRWLSTYWSRWGANWFKCEGRIRGLAPGALTKVNEGGLYSGPPLRSRRPGSTGRPTRPRLGAIDPQATCSRSARIRPWRNDVRLDRLPKDHARCAAAGIVGGDGNSIAIGFAEELHAKAFVKCDGLQT